MFGEWKAKGSPVLNGASQRQGSLHGGLSRSLSGASRMVRYQRRQTSILGVADPSSRVWREQGLSPLLVWSTYAVLKRASSGKEAMLGHSAHHG